MFSVYEKDIWEIDGREPMNRKFRKWRLRNLSNNIEVIAIDHGWSQIKTPTALFTTAVSEVYSPTFTDNLLEYNGKNYSIGGNRLEVKNTKVENEDFYLLTLAATARELKDRGLTEANVYWAVGLPLTRFGKEKQPFIDYLSKNEEVRFKFEDAKYHIKVVKVSVYPQCYSAVAEMIPNFARKAVVVDIGSWTVDIMPVVNKKPDDAQCNSLPHGLITCMKEINKICIKEFNYELDEKDIEHYMRFKNVALPEDVVKLLEQKLIDYTNMIYNSIREHGINLQTTPIIFVGGGACVMKNFTENKLPNVEYKTDVKANAKGYEMLARIALRNRRQS